MGDVAMAVPVIHLFQKTYPDVKLTVLTKPFFAKIFEHVEGVSTISADVKHEHKGVLGLWKLHKQCKALGIDAVADLHNVLRSKALRYFFSLSGISSEAVDKGRAEKKALTRDTDKVLKQLKTTHQRYADVFEKLGYPIHLALIKKHKQTLKPETLKLLNPHNSYLTPLTFIGIAPFAAHEGKQYPIELMTEVIEKLSVKGTYSVLLFGGGLKETEVLNNIADAHENVTSVAGKISFEQDLALISNLKVMLSMDSGTAHLAAMFGVPVVTLWGVTHPYAGFVPFGQPDEHQLLPDLEKYPKIPTSIYGNKIPEGYEDVMRSISPEIVVEKLISLAQ